MAAFLSVLCAYLIKQAVGCLKTLNYKKSILYLLGAIVSLALALGLYQAYLCVTIGLLMIGLLDCFLKDTSLKSIITYLAVCIVVLLVAGAMYFVTWKVFQKAFHIWTANTYNGLADVMDYSQTSIWKEIVECYRRTGLFLGNPDVFHSLEFRGKSLAILWEMLLIACNVFTILSAFIIIIVGNIKKKSVLKAILQCILLGLFPFGINIVCFLSKGMEHTLMMFAMNLIYVLAVWLFVTRVENKRKWMFPVFSLPILLVIWTNVVYANQVYLKKELLYEAADSLLTRIVSDIEDVEGYIPSETPVVIYGSYEQSEYIPQLSDFEDVVCVGMGKTCFTYSGLDRSYLKHILNVSINFTNPDLEDPFLKEQIADMPCYPKRGSVQMIGELLVIKISE